MGGGSPVRTTISRKLFEDVTFRQRPDFAESKWALDPGLGWLSCGFNQAYAIETSRMSTGHSQPTIQKPRILSCDLITNSLAGTRCEIVLQIFSIQ